MKAKTMGERIKALREGRALSQQALAVLLGVSVSQVSRWERDEQEPSVSSLRALARELAVSLDELIGR